MAKKNDVVDEAKKIKEEIDALKKKTAVLDSTSKSKAKKTTNLRGNIRYKHNVRKMVIRFRRCSSRMFTRSHTWLDFRL